MPQWIDYKELKREIAFEDVLDHYGIDFPPGSDQIRVECPLPSHGDNSGGSEGGKTLSVNTDRNIFQCFSCGAKGNVVDFIALMENLDPANKRDFHKAALLAKRKFLYTPRKPRRESETSRDKPETKATGPNRVIVNPPMDFELQGLDQEHPWFAEHGFEPETVKYFGAGYCKRGLMKGRIAIPLHDDDGQLIGYVGRLVDEGKVSPTTPLDLYPTARQRCGIRYEFDRTLLLYHGHEVREPGGDLIVAFDPIDVWCIWQDGHHNVVGIMDTTMSRHQLDLVLNRLNESADLIFAINGDIE